MDVSRRRLSSDDSQDGTVARVSIDSSEALCLDGGRLLRLVCLEPRRVFLLGLLADDGVVSWMGDCLEIA